MTDIDWDEPRGGLMLAAQSFDFKTPHVDADIRVMLNSIKSVTQTHGASFNVTGFRHNLHALNNGDMHATLFKAKWKECADEICLGAAFGWKTYGFTPEGLLVPSYYTEDVALIKGALRQLIRTKPVDCKIPDEGIAECLERITLQNLRNQGVVYRFGEVSLDNTTMMRQLTRNGAQIGNAVLEFKNLPDNLRETWPIDTKIIPIFTGSVKDKNNFIIECNHDGYVTREIATKGQKTSAGRPRVDLRPWRNGEPPEPEIMKCVTNSSLLAMKEEADERKWGNRQCGEIPSPVIPLLASRPDLYRALYGSAGNEIVINITDRPKTFDEPLDDVHVFIQDSEEALKGYMDAGATTRVFGDQPMKPGVNVLRNEFRLSI